jgi:hypothetical protein
MTFKIATAALLAALAPAAVMAESVTLTAPGFGATLQGEAVDMSVYFIDGSDGAFDVVATYVGDDEPGQPYQLIMELREGDDVRFALPGHAETLYQFQRVGGIVSVTDGPADVVPATTS